MMQKAVIDKILRLDGRESLTLKELCGTLIEYNTLDVKLDFPMFFYFIDRYGFNKNFISWVVKFEDKESELVVETESNVYYFKKVE